GSSAWPNSGKGTSRHTTVIVSLPSAPPPCLANSPPPLWREDGDALVPLSRSTLAYGMRAMPQKRPHAVPHHLLDSSDHGGDRVILISARSCHALHGVRTVDHLTLRSHSGIAEAHSEPRACEVLPERPVGRTVHFVGLFAVGRREDHPFLDLHAKRIGHLLHPIQANPAIPCRFIPLD